MFCQSFRQFPKAVVVRQREADAIKRGFLSKFRCHLQAPGVGVVWINVRKASDVCYTFYGDYDVVAFEMNLSAHHTLVGICLQSGNNADCRTSLLLENVTNDMDPVEMADVHTLYDAGAWHELCDLLDAYNAYKKLQRWSVACVLSPPDVTQLVAALPRKANESSRRYKRRRAKAGILWQARAVVVRSLHLLLPALSSIVCSYL
jgi:hypothetical protein